MEPFISPNNRLNTRDHLIDFLKGAAIILVVIGHTLQGNSPDFDKNFWFRLIYSFHMPLFMLLAGILSYRDMHKFLSVYGDANFNLLSHVISDIRSKAFRLLLPYLSWGILAYFIQGRYEHQSITEYLFFLLRHPDNGLWFLPALFGCHIFSNIFKMALFYFGKFLKNIYFTIVLSYLFSHIALNLTPQFFVVYLTKIYFPFFALGVIWGYFKLCRLHSIMHEFIFVLFLLLIPFWHRTEPTQLLSLIDAARIHGIFNDLLKAVVAISGAYIFTQTMKAFYEEKISAANTAIEYLGKKV